MLKLDFLLLAVALSSIFLFSCTPATNQSTSDTEAAPPQRQYLAYFGTYTRGGDSKGIYAYRFDPSSGRMTEIGLVAEVADPSFLAVHPNNRTLYSVTESPEGAVRAFAIDHDTGNLTFLNEVPSGAAGPCHVNVDGTGRMLAVANYHGGSTATFPIRRDGSLGEAASVIQHQGSSVDPRRQGAPHAHSVNFSPDNRFLIVADLGTDKLMVYQTDLENGTIQPHHPAHASVTPGGGPRHLSFHPSGRFAYVINEMGNTVTAFRYDAPSGTLQETQVSATLPENYQGASHTAEIRVHPSGKFLYGSNRGHDSIAVFSIDEPTGRLTPVERVSTQGETPRNFNFDPAGRYLIAENQDTDNVVIFEIDQVTGKLTPTGQTLQIPSPVCLRFVPLD